VTYHTLVAVGRLVKDPELRYTPQGKAVTTLNLAVDDGWGENKRTIWMRVTVWDKQAESVSNYLKKGRQVFIEGRLQPDKETGNPRVFTRQDGTSGASYEVVANVVRFLGGREDAAATSAESSDELPMDDNSEIPF
jgi:single-strand DNA-binding protein